MATFWVDSETGDDGDDGSTQALAKATLAAGLALITGTVGNTLNVVARATAYLVNSTNVLSNCAGSSYSSFGCLIRSTDINGVPDPSRLARVIWEDSATAHTAIRFQGTSDFCIVEGFDCDRSPNTTAATTKRFVEINSTSAGHIWVRACIDRPKASPQVSGHLLNLLTNNTNNIGVVSHCYFIDPRSNSGVLIPSGASCTFEYHHCVHEHNITQPAFHVINANFGATTDLSIHHNTIIVRKNGRALLFQGNHTTADAAAKMTLHSNIVAELTRSRANSSLMAGNSSWEGVGWDGTLDIGWNIFTTVDAGFVWTAVQPYQVPWDPDNSDSPDDTGQDWATDVATTEQDPFNNSDAAWVWQNAGGFGYNLPLSGDLRLLAHRTADKTGGVPGAIANGIVSNKNIKFLLSGGATNSNPHASFGGVMSSRDIATSLIDALFDNVSAGEATSGITEYRCYYVKNTSIHTWFAAEVWIESDTTSADTALAIGLDPVGNGDGVSTGVATTIANETTAPTGVTFTSPTSSPGLSIGDLLSGQVRAVWVRRIVNAAAAVLVEDRAIIRHSGSDV